MCVARPVSIQSVFNGCKWTAWVTNHDDLGTGNCGTAVERHVQEVGASRCHLLSLIADEACKRPSGDSIRRQAFEPSAVKKRFGAEPYADPIS